MLVKIFNILFKCWQLNCNSSPFWNRRMHAKAKTHFVVEIILKILMALKCPAKSNHLSLPSPSFFLSICLCLLPLARPQFASDRPVVASYNQKNKIFTPSKAQSAGFICFHCGCYVVALFTSVYIRSLPFFLYVLPSYYVFKFSLFAFLCFFLSVCFFHLCLYLVSLFLSVYLL